MTASDLQQHIRYSAWASRRLMDAVRALPSADLVRPTGISHQSILGTMAHLHFADSLTDAELARVMNAAGYGLKA